MLCGSVYLACNELLRHPWAAQGGLLRGALRGRSCAGLGRVFGSALGLDVGGVENAIVSELAFRQRLRVVLEGVRGRLAAVINHGQRAILLDQLKLQV